MKVDNARIQNIVSKSGKLDGFKLIGYKASYEFYSKSGLNIENWTRSLTKMCISLNISARYTFGRMLGKGNFARVHLAWRKLDSQVFAIKTIEKAKVLSNPRSVQSLYKEISIMRKLNHPNIIRLYEVYENDTYIHLVLEYLEGGELFQRLQSKGSYSEKDAAVLLKSLLEAISYCHSLNVIHRDLKPENLIFAY